MEKAKTNGTAATPTKKALLFVVDDETMLLELATLILEPVGYKVKTFSDPVEALKAFTTASPRPALVLTDYAMHSMNGMMLVEKFRQLEPRQKIVLVSGTVGTEVFQNAVSKPNHFLSKPYHAKELIYLVGSNLAD